MKMEQIECSETSAYIIQRPGNYPKENIIYSEHGESFKSRVNIFVRYMYNITLYTHTHFVRWCTSTERLCTNCVCGLAAGLNAPVQNEPKVTVHLHKRGVRRAKCFFFSYKSYALSRNCEKRLLSSSCLSVILSVYMKQPGFPWTDIHGICRVEDFFEISQEISSFIKIWR